MNRLVRQAFTLIELLVVIAIIGILSGLIVVSMNGSINSANDAKRKAGIDTIRKALIIYGTLNKGVYPSGNGCNIGPVGTPIPICDLSSIAEILPNLPVDPVSGYYNYVSDGATFTVSSVLSSKKSYGYSSLLNGFYSSTSTIARSSSSSLYDGINSLTGVNTSVNDSANGSLSGYVANYVGPVETQLGLTSLRTKAGIYDVFIRIRGSTNSLGFSVYNGGPPAEWIYVGTVNGITSTYQVKYIGKFTVTGAMADKFMYFYSNAPASTSYYFDYIEFRPTI
jgi:prepilin-type N-terminal cleavage/methylation domain-containing protein